MNANLATIADMDHQIVDAFWAALFLALFSGLGWIINRGFNRMEKRHERAEDKFEELDDTVGDHETRITVLEKTDQRDRD